MPRSPRMASSSVFTRRVWVIDSERRRQTRADCLARDASDVVHRGPDRVAVDAHLGRRRTNGTAHGVGDLVAVFGQFGHRHLPPLVTEPAWRHIADQPLPVAYRAAAPSRRVEAHTRCASSPSMLRQSPGSIGVCGSLASITRPLLVMRRPGRNDAMSNPIALACSRHYQWTSSGVVTPGVIAARLRPTSSQTVVHSTSLR